MTDDTPRPRRSDGDSDRQARLRAALRDNLGKRKAQARARRAAPVAEPPTECNDTPPRED